MSLDNLILQVYLKDNTTYSNIISNLLSLSNDIICKSPNLIYGRDMRPITSEDIQILVSEVHQETNYDKKQSGVIFIEKIKQFKNINNGSIFDNKFTLPENLEYKMFFDTSIKKVKADYTKNQYLEILEYINSKQNILFNHRLTSTIIDEKINSKIDYDYINLAQSSNFCYSILKQLADMKNESVDIDHAMNYFYNKPIEFIYVAIDCGIKHILNTSGYYEYKEYILNNCQTSFETRANIHDVKMKTLILPVYELSYVAYEKLYQHCGLEQNDNAFKKWHQWLFDGDYCFDETSIPSLLNIIAKLMTGRPFDPRNWTMENQIVFDCAVEEKLGITDGVTAYKEYINNGSRT